MRTGWRVQRREAEAREREADRRSRAVDHEQPALAGAQSAVRCARSSARRFALLTIALAVATIATTHLVAEEFFESHLGALNAHRLATGLMALVVILVFGAAFKLLDSDRQRAAHWSRLLSSLDLVTQESGSSSNPDHAARLMLDVIVEALDAAAAEVVVRPVGTAEEARRVGVGAASDLALLRQLDDQLAGAQADATAAGSVRVTDLAAEREPGAVEACVRGHRVWAQMPLSWEGTRIGAVSLLGGSHSLIHLRGAEELLETVGRRVAAGVRGWPQQASPSLVIGPELDSTWDMDDVLRSTLERARQTLDGDAAVLCVATGPEGKLAPVMTTGTAVVLRRRRSGGSVTVQLLRPKGGTAVCICKPDECPGLVKPYCDCCLSAPVVAGGSVLGGLCVAWRQPRPADEQQRSWLRAVADTAAVTLVAARAGERERCQATMQERNRLARELHDGPAQALGYVHLRARAIQRTLARADLERAAKELDDLASVAEQAYATVRLDLEGLREAAPSSQDFLAPLCDCTQSFSRRSGIPVRLDSALTTPVLLALEAEVQVLRVVHEALTNVWKHAGATTVTVRVRRDTGAVVIEVVDDGRGFYPELLGRMRGHFGLQTMRERVQQVGGQLAVESARGRGTVVSVRVPEGRHREHDSDEDPARG